MRPLSGHQSVEDPSCDDNLGWSGKWEGNASERFLVYSDSGPVSRTQPLPSRFEFLTPSEGVDTLQACGVEVSGVAGEWRECDINQQQETDVSDRTNPPRSTVSAYSEGGGLC